MSHSYTFFLKVRLLFLIAGPIWDATRVTLYEKEVLAPGNGHYGAPGLISSQVIRETGGAHSQGHVGQEETDRVGEGDREREEEGIVGLLYTHQYAFVVPEDPCCGEQACRGQILRITTPSSSIYLTQ